MNKTGQVYLFDACKCCRDKTGEGKREVTFWSRSRNDLTLPRQEGKIESAVQISRVNIYWAEGKANEKFLRWDCA